MQAALHDLALTRRETPSFVVCQRVLQKCHEIIFGDLPPPIPAPYASLSVPSRSRFLRKKIKPRLEPALVGIGCVLASVPGMPQLAEVTGKVAVEQGRWEDSSTRHRPVNGHAEDEVAPGQGPAAPPSPEEEESEEEEDYTPTKTSNTSRTKPTNKSSSSLITGRRRERSVGAAQTTPALHHTLGMEKLSLSKAAEDPLGQLDEPAPSHFVSAPVISDSQRHPLRPNMQPADILLQKYDVYSQSLLLRSHYLRGEVCMSILFQL